MSKLRLLVLILCLIAISFLAPNSISAQGGDPPVIQITDNDARDIGGRWSPDGTKLTFMSTRDGEDTEIYIMDADGSNVVQVTDNDFGDYGGWWSPDGTKLIVTSEPEGESIAYLMDLDGSNITQIVPDTAGFTSTSGATYSPDEQWFMFRGKQEGSDITKLYIMNVAEEEIIPLTGDDDGTIIGADWSADGTQIVYSADGDGDYEIYVMDVDGSNVSQLTDNDSKDSNPQSSPDGTRLAFISNRDGDDEIYIMDVDGSNVYQLTHNDRYDANPHWSPDSTKIAFGSNGDGDYEILIMDLSEWTPPSCEVSAGSVVNLRSGPGTTYDIAGTLAAGDTVPVVGQALASDGFVWWQLSAETWVRSDVVNSNGYCDNVPEVAVAE